MTNRFDESMFTEAIGDLSKGVLHTEVRPEPSIDPNVEFVNVRVSMLLGQTRIYPMELPPLAHDWHDANAELLVTGFADKCEEIADDLRRRMGQDPQIDSNDLRSKLHSVRSWFHTEFGEVPQELQEILNYEYQ